MTSPMLLQPNWLTRWKKVITERLRYPQLRLAVLATILVVSVWLGVLAGIRILLPSFEQFGWERTLFPWDPMQPVPKFVYMLLYVAWLVTVIALLAVWIRFFNSTEESATRVLARGAVASRKLINAKGKLALAILLLACFPLVWALAVTPFRVPNEFLALPTKSILGADGQTNLQFFAKHNMEGLVIPEPGAKTDMPPVFTVPGAHAQSLVKNLAVKFPEFYWFDEKAKTLEVHRIGNTEQYQLLANIVDSGASLQLNERFVHDKRASLDFVKRQYTDTERKFLKQNRPELERALVLGRFFYHHNFIFSAVVARVQDPGAKHGSQYGLGLTQAFAGILATVPEVYRFNAYLSLLYASYPLYLLLVLGVAFGCGLRRWPLVFVGTATLFSFVLSEIETVRLGVGLAPWRHIFDVLVLGMLWRYTRSPSKANLAGLALLSLLAVYWSREMGLFIGLASAGAIGANAIQQRCPRGLWPAVGLVCLLALAWPLSDPHAQTMTWAILLGLNTPPLPWWFIGVMVFGIGSMFAGWLWLGRQVNDQVNGHAAWVLFGATVLYVAASGVYLIFYPRPHHLAPVLPALALGAVVGWVSLGQASLKEATLRTLNTLAYGVTTGLFLGLFVLGVLRNVEIMREQNIFRHEVLYRWDFPAAQLSSTGNPALLQESVAMIRANSPEAEVNILSPWEVVLLPMSGKGKDGPFVVSFDSLVTDAEVNMLAQHLLRSKHDVLFMDTRLAQGRYELPLSESAYMRDYVMASVLRLRAHATLRQVFARVRDCYDLQEEGPLISVYKRVSRDCQTKF